MRKFFISLFSIFLLLGLTACERKAAVSENEVITPGAEEVEESEETEENSAEGEEGEPLPPIREETGIYGFEAIRQKYFAKDTENARLFLSDLDTPLIMSDLHNSFLGHWEFWVENKHAAEETERDGVMKKSVKNFEYFENLFVGYTDENEEEQIGMIELTQEIQKKWDDIAILIKSVCNKQKSSVACK